MGAVNGTSGDNETVKVTEPQYQTLTDYLAHFIYAFLYETSAMLFVVLSTKCCANQYVKKDTIYYKLCLINLGFGGFPEPNWFCNLFPCRICKTINAKATGRSIDERSKGSSDVPKVSYSTDKQPNGVLSPKKNKGIGAMDGNDDNKDGADTPESDGSDSEMKDITLVLSEVENDIGGNNDDKAANKPKKFKSKYSLRHLHHLKTHTQHSKDSKDDNGSGNGNGNGLSLNLSFVSSEDGKSGDTQDEHHPSPGTPTQRHDSSHHTFDHSSNNKLDESQIDMDLKNMNFKGQKLHKRKKPKAKHTSDELKEKVKEKMKQNKIRPIAEQTKHHHTTKIANKEDTYAPYVDGVSVLENSAQNNGDHLVFDSNNGNVTSNTLSSGNTTDTATLSPFNSASATASTQVLTKPSAPITLVIFEFEYVLATMMTSIKDRTVNDITYTDLKKMLLAYGGVDRVDLIHIFMTNVVMAKEENACFMITNEASETVYKVFFWLCLKCSFCCLLPIFYFFGLIVLHFWILDIIDFLRYVLAIMQCWLCSAWWWCCSGWCLWWLACSVQCCLVGWFYSV